MHTFKLTENPEFVMRSDGLLCNVNAELAREHIANGGVFLPADPKQIALGTIERLERENMMPRATREFMLSFMEASFPPAQLATNIGYQKVKALDDQLRAERAKLV